MSLEIKPFVFAVIFKNKKYFFLNCLNVLILEINFKNKKYYFNIF